MAQNILLLIHNFGYSAAAIILVLLGVALFKKEPKSAANKLLIFTFGTAIVVIVSHILGVSTHNPDLSRFILMFNVAGILCGVFLVHAVLSHLGKDKQLHIHLAVFYTIAVCLIIFFKTFPYTYLLQSVPFSFFPSYYVAGGLYSTTIFFNAALALFLLYHTSKAYTSADATERNRISYFVIAYALGIISAIIIFPGNSPHPISPSWGALSIPMFAAMLTYAFLKHDLMNIRVLVRNACTYILLITGVSLFIIFFNVLSNTITEARPGFPLWLLPLLSSSLAVAIGLFVWNEFRKGELLKYEFISVVTDKFRAPLTHIKWASENLSSRTRKEEDQAQLSYITSANLKLIELTDLLMTVSDTENTSYSYKFQQGDLSQIVDEVISSLHVHIESRKTQLKKTLEPNLMASFDQSRIRFVLQTLIENAINYTPIGGEIAVTTKREGSLCVFSVKDTGIGISQSELPLLFSKFYRSKKAKLTDTEGMGVGLYMAKEILSLHNGRIWAESEGEGKGSTFSCSLPAIT
jgi:signal transduction histidine kinase